MTQDNKNLYLAIALSILVIIGWNYFYGAPKLEKAREAQTQTQTGPLPPGTHPSTLPAAPGNPQAAPATEPVESTQTRAEALASSPRIKLDTPSLSGSIDLKGARIDDVLLKAYRETTDPHSPHIQLLSPIGSPHPYFAELGFVAKAGESLALPGPGTLWKADRQELTTTTPVTLSYDNGHGLIFNRKISIDNRYMFTIVDSVDNKSGAPVTLYPYAVVSKSGQPEISHSSLAHVGFVGVFSNSEEKETYEKIVKEPKETKTIKGTGGWLGLTDQYWAAVVIPDQSVPFEGTYSARGTTNKIFEANFLETGGVAIAPGATSQVTTRVFAGAKETQTLDDYQHNLGLDKFDLLIDWGWLYFITKPMFRLLDLIYKFVGNFGVAILIVTVLIKGTFFPLANRSYLSMAKMKAAQPQMTAIRERFADDKVKQQQEMMELYKREKINPVSGCLPMLIQVPVFWAYYTVLSITIEMRHAPFFGWIKDLSAPDPTNVFTLFGLIHWDPTALPVIGHFLALGIWPLIMGFSMFVQMKMNPEPPDPIQKQMFTWMPVIFTFMLGTFPSGLVIYWTWNNILSVSQQALIMRRAGIKIELWDNLASLFRKKALT
ncbi:MAG TPA: membrane protein insertase YidC [Methylovirgula sp.]